MVIKTNILSFNSAKKLVFQKNVFLIINDGIINGIISDYEGDFTDYSAYVVLPGFIDTHVHIAQYKIMGMQEPHLLDWLNKYTFPEEKRFENPEYADQISQLFFQEVLRQGTTCISAYVTIHKEACDIVFQNAEKSGIRALIGKVMMDCNCPEYLCENTWNSLEDSIRLYEKWHNHSPLLDYIFSPRFAPVCSLELMTKIGRFAQDNNAYIQTHLSENTGEVEWIRSLYPQYHSYTDIYYKCGLMGPKSIFGHCVHLTDNEISLFKETHSRMAYCADSNFYLRSGEFDLERMESEGINFALASDIGAGTSLSMPYHGKIAIYRQTKALLDPLKAFYLMTLGGAEVLSMQNKIGSIESGKESDMVFYHLDDLQEMTPEQIISKIIFTDQSDKIRLVMIHGETVYERDFGN